MPPLLLASSVTQKNYMLAQKDGLALDNELRISEPLNVLIIFTLVLLYAILSICL